MLFILTNNASVRSDKNLIIFTFFRAIFFIIVSANKELVDLKCCNLKIAGFKKCQPGVVCSILIFYTQNWFIFH